MGNGPVARLRYIKTRPLLSLFRSCGLFGSRSSWKIELDLALTVQDEPRSKRFAGSGPEAGEDLLRAPLLEQLAREVVMPGQQIGIVGDPGFDGEGDVARGEIQRPLVELLPLGGLGQPFEQPFASPPSDERALGLPRRS